MTIHNCTAILYIFTLYTLYRPLPPAFCPSVQGLTPQSRGLGPLFFQGAISPVLLSLCVLIRRVMLSIPHSRETLVRHSSVFLEFLFLTAS